MFLLKHTTPLFYISAHLNETFYKRVSGTDKSLILSKPRSQFAIWVDINPDDDSTVKNGKLSSAGFMIHLKRDTIGLLLGSYYVPTGIFAVLAMASYVINPDAVSIPQLREREQEEFTQMVWLFLKRNKNVRNHIKL